MADPTAINFRVPDDIISKIFSTLPVRSICRFRSVCSSWANFPFQSHFIATHINNSSMLTLIQKKNVRDISSVFSLMDSSRKIFRLVSPFPHDLFELEIVASLKGIICLCRPPWGDMVTLWNPAARMFKFVRLSSHSKSRKQPASVGMADNGQEIFVIRLIFSNNKREIEIISVNRQDSEWIHRKSRLDLDIKNKRSCDVVFNGEPYWVAFESKENRKLEVLVKFDVADMVLKTHPITFKEDGDYNKLLVKMYNNSMLGMLVWNDEPTSNTEGWGFHENQCWEKLWTVSPPGDIDRILGLSIKGHIIVEYDDRLVFIICQGPHEVLVVSPQFRVQIGERRREIGVEGSFEVLEMKQSPLILEGMTPVLDDRNWSYDDIRDYIN